MTSNLAKRILSAAILIPAVLALILFAPVWSISGVVIALAIASSLEFSSIALSGVPSSTRWVIAALTGLLCLSIRLYETTPLFFMINAVLIMPVCSVLFMTSPLPHAVSFTNLAKSVTGIMYTGGLFGIISLLPAIHANGRNWILLLIVATVFSDSFAYIIGRLFGTTKLMPSVSPGKTRAGALGSIAGTIGAFFLADYLFMEHLHWWQNIGFGILVSICCQCGDLIESYLKRAFNTKDSGTLIPGHGGILDRCDAMMLGAPAVYILSMM